MNHLDSWELYFISQTVWGLQVQDGTLRSLWGTDPKSQSGKPGHTGVFATKVGSHNIKRLLLKETKYLKWRNIVLFYVWEDTRVCVPWNPSFDLHLSCLGPCFLTLRPSGCTTPWLPRWAASWRASVPTVSLSALTGREAVMWWLEGCDILCLLTRRWHFPSAVWEKPGASSVCWCTGSVFCPQSGRNQVWLPVVPCSESLNLPEPCRAARRKCCPGMFPSTWCLRGLVGGQSCGHGAALWGH